MCQGLVDRIKAKFSPSKGASTVADTSTVTSALPETSTVSQTASSAVDSAKQTAAKGSKVTQSFIHRHPMIVGGGVPLLAFLVGLLMSFVPIMLLGHTSAHQSIVSRIVRGPKDLFSYPKGSFAAHAHRQLDRAIKQQKKSRGSMFGSGSMLPSFSDMSPFSHDEDEDEHQSMMQSMMSHVPLVGSHFAHHDENDEDDYGSSMTSKAMKAYMATQTGKKAARGVKSWLPSFKSSHDEAEDESSSWMSSMMGSHHDEDEDQNEDEYDNSWLSGDKQRSKKRRGGIVSSVVSSLPLIGNSYSDQSGRLSRQEEKELQRLIDQASRKAHKASY